MATERHDIEGAMLECTCVLPVITRKPIIDY